MNALDFKAKNVKVVEGRPIVLWRKCGPMNLLFGNIWLMQMFKENTENECV